MIIRGPNLNIFSNRGFEWTYQNRQMGRGKCKPYLNRREFNYESTLWGSLDKNYLSVWLRFTKVLQLNTECIQLIRILKSHTVQVTARFKKCFKFPVGWSGNLGQSIWKGKSAAFNKPTARRMELRCVRALYFSARKKTDPGTIQTHRKFQTTINDLFFAKMK